MTVRDLRKACQDADIPALLVVSFRLERMRPPCGAGEQLLSPRGSGGSGEAGRETEAGEAIWGLGQGDLSNLLEAVREGTRSVSRGQGAGAAREPGPRSAPATWGGTPRTGPAHPPAHPGGRCGPAQTHGRSCGPPSRTAASLAGRRRGRTPGAPGRGSAAPGRMRTASAHTGPRKARGPPGRGSGRTRRTSSESGTAPTGPAGRRGHLGRLPPTRPGVP